MTKALLFGTFNPPTLAHINMGTKARKILGEECQVIYIPTCDRYIKDAKHYVSGQIMPGKIRVELLQKAVAPHCFSVSPIEINEIVSGKTYDSIEYLGFDDTWLCIGMDNLTNIMTWYRHEELLVFKRETSFVPFDGSCQNIINMAKSCRFTNLNPAYCHISGTKARQVYMAQDWNTLKKLVPDEIFHYLEENKNVYT